MLEKRTIAREGTFEWFVENCEYYRKPDWPISERTSWSDRCLNFRINNRGLPNCYGCIHKPLNKKD